ncbi:MAG: PspC domain-containing protein [Clostridiales bacterium]|nr:PspC domain-containing protein [Clostridiales bacterium]
MDETPKLEFKPGTSWKLRELTKSARDKKIAGVCGGFGESTPLPAWLWRVVFLTSLFFGGIGLIAYVILWICMPPAKQKH